MQKLVFKNGKGTEIDLTSGCYGITEWSGFSADGLNIQSQQVPFQDGSVFLDALMEQRDLSVTLAINDENNLETRYQKRRELIALMNPKLGEGLLIYTNDFISKQIHVIPQLPVFQNKNSNDAGTPKASLSWTACNPYWEDLEEKGVNLTLGSNYTIENEGDVPAQMEIEFLTSGVTNPEIINNTNDKKIMFNGSLTSNLSINTNIGKKEVYSEIQEFKLEQQGVNFNSICYSDSLGLYVAVTEEGAAFVSSDLAKWEVINLENNRLTCIVYAKHINQFIISGPRVAGYYTSYDGYTWTKRQFKTSQGAYVSISAEAMEYTEELSLIVIVGASGSINISSDAETWSKTHSGGNTLYGVRYFPEKEMFIAVGRTLILSSSDAVTWNSASGQVPDIRLTDIALLPAYRGDEIDYLFFVVGYSNTLLSVAGESGSCIVLSSVTLTPEGASVSSNFQNIFFNIVLNKTFISGSGGKVISLNMDDLSFDSAEYEVVSTGVTSNIYRMIYNSDSELSVIAGWRSAILSSSDTETWIKKINYFSENLNSIVSSNNTTVIVGTTGFIATRSNGGDWVERNSNVTDVLYKVIYSKENSRYVAVGKIGAILTSADGVTWTSRTSGVSENLNDITYSAEKALFIAVGDAGTILTSTNGISWSSSSSGTSENLNGVVYGKYFLAVGNNGTILKSSDGMTWSNDVSNFSYNLFSVTYNKNKNMYITVGSSGCILVKQGAWVNKSIGSGTFYCVKYFSEKDIFYALNNGKVYKSKDGISWVQDFSSSFTTLKDIAYVVGMNTFIAVGSNGTVLSSYISGKENQIQNITLDSDIGFNLEVGQNQIKLLRNSGDFSAFIKFRQKYIGV